MYYHYVIHYFITLLVSSLFCIGLWISRSGESEVSPNGLKVDKWSMIFYPIYKWLAKPRLEIIEYTLPQFLELADMVKVDFGKEMDLYFKFCQSKSIITLSSEQFTNWLSVAKHIKNEYGVKMCIHENNVVSFYKEYYRVRTWTKPIIACYKCFASFWGAILFTISSLFAIRLEYINLDLFILIPMCIIFLLNLVVVNVLLEKISK